VGFFVLLVLLPLVAFGSVVGKGALVCWLLPWALEIALEVGPLDSHGLEVGMQALVLLLMPRIAKSVVLLVGSVDPEVGMQAQVCLAVPESLDKALTILVAAPAESERPPGELRGPLGAVSTKHPGAFQFANELTALVVEAATARTLPEPTEQPVQGQLRAAGPEGLAGHQQLVLSG